MTMALRSLASGLATVIRSYQLPRMALAMLVVAASGLAISTIVVMSETVSVQQIPTSVEPEESLAAPARNRVPNPSPTVSPATTLDAPPAPRNSALPPPSTPDYETTDPPTHPPSAEPLSPTVGPPATSENQSEKITDPLPANTPTTGNNCGTPDLSIQGFCVPLAAIAAHVNDPPTVPLRLPDGLLFGWCAEINWGGWLVLGYVAGQYCLVDDGTTQAAVVWGGVGVGSPSLAGTVSYVISSAETVEDFAGPSNCGGLSLELVAVAAGQFCSSPNLTWSLYLGVGVSLNRPTSLTGEIHYAVGYATIVPLDHDTWTSLLAFARPPA